jgi:NAD-dependent deacetylase
MENTIEDLIKAAARDLINSKYVIALTGAGISTESGIPDFRGPSGIWTKNPDAERKAFRSYERFLADPKGWWEERLLMPFGLLGDLDNVMPNPGHYALTELEYIGILKYVITQNVDGLHQKAGLRNVLDYHGNVFKLRCVTCCARYNRTDFDLEKLRRENQLPPHCSNCGGILKTDGVAFGEPIPSDMAHQSLEEAYKCDLMLICGTSAVVYPFADLPRTARQKRTEMGRHDQIGIYAAGNDTKVTIIEINAEPTPLTHGKISDYLIQGKIGEILPQIVEEVKRIIVQ